MNRSSIKWKITAPTLLIAFVMTFSLVGSAAATNSQGWYTPSVPIAGKGTFEFDPGFVNTFESRGIQLTPIFGAQRTSPTKFTMPLGTIDLFDSSFRLNHGGGIKFWNSANKRYYFYDFSLMAGNGYLAANNNGWHRVGIFQFRPIENTLQIDWGHRIKVSFDLEIVLSGVSARTLNETFETDIFYQGMPVASENVEFRFNRGTSNWLKAMVLIGAFGNQFD